VRPSAIGPHPLIVEDIEPRTVVVNPATSQDPRVEAIERGRQLTGVKADFEC